MIGIYSLIVHPQEDRCDWGQEFEVWSDDCVQWRDLGNEVKSKIRARARRAN